MRIENVRLSGGFKIAKPSLEDCVRAMKKTRMFFRGG